MKNKAGQMVVVAAHTFNPFTQRLRPGLQSELQNRQGRLHRKREIWAGEIAQRVRLSTDYQNWQSQFHPRTDILGGDNHSLKFTHTKSLVYNRETLSQKNQNKQTNKQKKNPKKQKTCNDSWAFGKIRSLRISLATQTFKDKPIIHLLYAAKQLH